MNKPALTNYISKFYVTDGYDPFLELYEAGISEHQLLACEAFLNTDIGQEYLTGERCIENYIDGYDFSNPIHVITYVGDRYGDGEVFGPYVPSLKN